MTEETSLLEARLKRMVREGAKEQQEYLHNSWKAMKARCLNPNHSAYHRYGGRGITICDRWLDSFESFVADVGPRPARDRTLDRINNNGNYEPSNVRWATMAEQQRNRRDNRLITINGKTQCLVDWATETGISREMVYSRMAQGWSVERAITTQKLEAHRTYSPDQTHRDCTRCHLTKPLEDFVKSSRSPTGRGPHCAECNRKMCREYWERKKAM